MAVTHLSLSSQPCCTDGTTMWGGVHPCARSHQREQKSKRGRNRVGYGGMSNRIAGGRRVTNGNELVKRCFSKSGTGTSRITVTTLEHQRRLSGEPTSEPQQAPEEPSCPPTCQSRTCNVGLFPLHCFLRWKTEIPIVLDLMPVTISSLNIHLSLSLS